MRKLVFLFILGAPALALADANVNGNANHTVEIEIADAGAGHKDAARFVVAVSPSSQTVSFSTHSGDSQFEIGVRLDPNTHGYDVHLQRKGGAAPEINVFVAGATLPDGKRTLLEHSEAGGLTTEVTATAR